MVRISKYYVVFTETLEEAERALSMKPRDWWMLRSFARVVRLTNRFGRDVARQLELRRIYEMVPARMGVYGSVVQSFAYVISRVYSPVSIEALRLERKHLLPKSVYSRDWDRVQRLIDKGFCDEYSDENLTRLLVCDAGRYWFVGEPRDKYGVMLPKAEINPDTVLGAREVDYGALVHAKYMRIPRTCTHEACSKMEALKVLVELLEDGE